MSQKLHSAKIQRLRWLWISYPDLPAPVIAIRLGCSERTIWNYVKSLGLKRPPAPPPDPDFDDF